mgnify:CR=1 FL=1
MQVFTRKKLTLDLSRYINTQTLDTYKLLPGTLCYVSQERNFTALINGINKHRSDPISFALASIGITGHIHISSEDDITRGRMLSKWLSHGIDSDNTDWLSKIHVTIFSDVSDPKILKQLPFKATVGEKLRLQDSDLGPSNNRWASYDSEYDGLLVMFKDRAYRFLPNRFIRGTIVSVSADAKTKTLKNFIIKVVYQNETYLIKTNRSSPYVLKDCYPIREDLIGRMVCVCYTSFLPGKRVSNFSSANISTLTDSYAEVQDAHKCSKLPAHLI